MWRPQVGPLIHQLRLCPTSACTADFHACDLAVKLALAANLATEDFDAGSGVAGWARFLAKLGTAMDAGEELVERDSGDNFGTWTPADGQALAGDERGVLPWVESDSTDTLICNSGASASTAIALFEEASFRTQAPR